MADNLLAGKKAAYFSGCFYNYYYPQVSQALVEILRQNNIEMALPDQVCCGLPMLAKGNSKGALKNMTRNAAILSQLVAEGYALVTACSSCALFLKQDYPRLLGTAQAKQVSQGIFLATEYLLKLHHTGLLNTDFKAINASIYYHTPCHLRAAQIGQPTVALLKLIPGITVKKIGEECCGMGGAYGYEKANFALSREISERLRTRIAENPADRIVTDCGGCRLQIQSVTGHKVEHPLILLREACGIQGKIPDSARPALTST